MITVVSGFGRCGSSMVMHMSAAGGMPVMGNAPAFEDSRVSRLPYEPAWLREAEGKALKILDPHQFSRPGGLQMRWIWLDRDAKEQAKSYIKFARAAGLPVDGSGLVRAKIAASYRADRRKTMRVIKKRSECDPLILRFEHILARPETATERISTYCGGLDVAAMQAVVRPRSPQCQLAE